MVCLSLTQNVGAPEPWCVNLEYFKEKLDGHWNLISIFMQFRVFEYLKSFSCFSPGKLGTDTLREGKD